MSVFFFFFFWSGLDGEPTPSLAEYEAKYGDFDSVKLLFEHSIVYELVKSPILGTVKDARMVETLHNRYLVLNPADEHLTSFKLVVDSKKNIQGITIEVLAPDGKKTHFDLTTIKLQTESNGREVYKVAYPNVVKGSIIDETIEFVTPSVWEAPNFYHNVELQFDVPAEKVRFSYIYPEKWEIKLKRCKAGEDLPVEKSHDAAAGLRKIRYEANDVPGIKDEPFAPHFKEVAQYAEFMVTRFSLAQASFNADQTWRDVAKNFVSFLDSNDAKLSTRVSKTARELTKDQSENQKIRTLVRYVQENISNDDRDAKNFAKILKTGQGNPFLNTALAMRMLEAVKIPARFTLIHSADDGYFDPNFISHHQFYLPALMVGNRLVLPYVKGLSIDHIPEPFQGQKVLTFDNYGQTKIEDVPYSDTGDSAVRERYELTLQEDGRILVKEEKELNGSMAFMARKLLEDESESKQQEILKDFLTYEAGEVKDLETEFQNYEDPDKPLVMILEYAVDNLLTITPDEVLFNTAGLFAPMSYKKSKVLPKMRTNPVRVAFEQVSSKDITLNFPASWSVDQIPETVQLSNAFGEIQAEYQAEGQQMKIHQTVKLHRNEASKESFPTLLEIVGSKSRLEIPTLVFAVIASE